MRGGFGRVGVAFSSPTCLKPRISDQNWCDSSRLRTFSTRWFRPDGVTGPGWFPDILSSCSFACILGRHVGTTLAPWGGVRPPAGETSEDPGRQAAGQGGAQIVAAADVVRPD